MKTLFNIFLFSIFMASAAYSQKYGNEWINYDQKYLKVPITKEGMYRINYSALNTACNSIGFPLSSINPKRIQVFARGEEQFIHVEGEDDFIFDANDFIEFYAEPNNGWFDSLLYQTPGHQDNPYYSNFNDTAYYFITWTTAGQGKRFIPISAPSNYPTTPASYFWKDQTIIYHQQYLPGAAYNEKYSPYYTSGEGWCSYFFSTPFTDTLKTPNLYSAGPASILKTNFAGANNNAHHLQIKNLSSGAILFDSSWTSYRSFHKTYAIPNTFGNNLPLLFDVIGASSQKKTISFISIKYPHTFDLEAKTKFKLELPYNASTTYTLFTNFSTNATPYLYDLKDHYRIQTTQTGSTIKALVPGSNPDASQPLKTCYLTTSSEIIPINTLIPVNSIEKNGVFTRYIPTLTNDSSYIIISHDKLWNGATSYASYRNSNGFVVILANINDVYDQYAYGIKKHPLSIRNFCREAWNTWSNKPNYLFLIGKSITNSNQTFRTDVVDFENNLIPSAGWPAVDNYFTQGLSGIPHVTTIPTGRLAATENSHVEAYLNKVINFEQVLNQPNDNMNISDKLWLKNIIHFGGGNPDNGEPATFKSYLRSYADTITNVNFGGKIFEFYKASANVIDYNLADSIRNLVNNGAILLSFFGHASANSFDVNIDQASLYNNDGKNFFILSNGCYSGDIHQANSLSISEDFVLVPSKGAIGFIAQSHLGIPPYLHAYSTQLYKNIARKLYNSSIGDCLKEAARVSIMNNPFDIITYSTALETTLHGDPALKLSSNELPDYAVVEPPQISFSPTEVSTDIDSFTVNLLISNLGKAVDKKAGIDIRRIFPDGTDTTYNIESEAIFYQNLISLKLPVLGEKSVGINRFEVRVNSTVIIDELTYSNNNIINIGNELLITSQDLTPIYPYNYAVVGTSTLTLKASTNNPLAPEKQYILQLDTTDLYNSPIKKELIVTQKGGVVSWDMNLPITNDSIVYFWRATPYSNLPESLRWKEFSFQYIPNQWGWGQDHFFQFKKDGFEKLNYNRTTRSISYDTTSSGLRAYNHGNPDVNQPEQLNGIKYELNGIIQQQGICNAQRAIFVAVIDPLTLKPWEKAWITDAGDTLNYPEHDFGNGNNLNSPDPLNCYGVGVNNRRERYFNFRVTDQTHMDSLSKMLTNKIPDGHYVLAYSVFPVLFQSGTELNNAGVKQAFAALGSLEINNLGDSIPWIFFIKKGDPSTRQETLGTHVNDIIYISTNIKGGGYYGEINSTKIGPAREWTSLHWNFNKLESNQGDTVSIEIYSDQGQLLKSFPNAQGNILNLEQYVKAKDYPYIQLKAKIKDKTNYTPAHNDKWHIIYDEAPEAALNYNYSYLMHSDTMGEGDVFKYAMPILNVSRKDMDSLRIHYLLTDEQGKTQLLPYPTQDSLKSGKTLLDTISVSTLGYRGRYYLKMEVNPHDSLWQKEQFHFNNITSASFYVQPDNQNPILDVTFDGVHILDGDIVSPKPEILITLKDENQYLILNEDKDTANFNIFLISPTGKSERVYFTTNGIPSTVLSYTKTQNAKTPFKIIYAPNLATDGVYKLKVQASDKSGNLAGKKEYSIAFEVIHKSTITQVMNYPNPFSTSTRFVFTLTGSVIPDVFKIQILSVSGKIVREITKDELGAIRIGRNISEYAWDGTDEYGDKIGNGVYLYRVITKINDTQIENRATNADQYFHKGFGKMYLMR